MSCPLPRPLDRPEAYLMDGSRVDWIKIYAWQGRLCSKVFKQLYSVSASRRTHDEIKASVKRLGQELAAWRDSIPILLRPGEAIKRNKLPIGIVGNYSVALHMMYWHLVCLIHRRSINCWSWLKSAERSSHRDEYSEHSALMDSSGLLVVEAARAVVMLTEHLNVESYTPSW